MNKHSQNSLYYELTQRDLHGHRDNMFAELGNLVTHNNVQ